MDVEIVESTNLEAMKNVLTELRNVGYVYVGGLVHNPTTGTMVQVMECQFVQDKHVCTDIPKHKLIKPKKDTKPICNTCNIPLIEGKCPICNNTGNKDVHTPIQGTKICASCIQNYNDELTACPKCQCTTVVQNAVDAAKEKERLTKLHEW